MSIRREVRRAPEYVFTAHPYRVKLDQNEAPDDLPDEVRERALAALSETPWHRYPELRAEALAHRLARRDGWDPAGVVVAAGSNVLIQAAVIAAGLGGRVLTVSPSFAVYASQARLLGSELTEVPLIGREFALDEDALTHELARGPGLLFLADPAAPSGNRLDDGAVAGVLRAAAEHDWTVVLDEAYWPFDGRHRLDEVRGHPGRIALRTLSKADGLGGVRLGYALGHPETVAQLAKVLLPFSVSALQSAIGCAVLDAGDAARQARVTLVRRERERIRGALDTTPGFHPLPSVTNFLLFRVADPAAVHSGLLRHGVLVRRQDHLPGLEGHLRVTVGSPADNDAFLAAARAVASEEAVHG